MSFNIQEFRSELDALGGINVTSKFLVIISPPPWYNQENGADNQIIQKLSFVCDTANIPGLSLETNDYRPQGFGVNDRRPSGINFENLQTTFYCDSDHRVVTFFQRWLQEIVNYSSVIKGDLASYKNLSAFELAYPEQYQTTITLIFFSKDDPNKYMEHTFLNCYPQQLGSVQLGWEQNDSIAKLPVEFYYTTYTALEKTLEFPVTGGEAAGIRFFERAAQLLGVYGVLSNLRRPRNIQDAINQTINVTRIFRNF